MSDLEIIEAHLERVRKASRDYAKAESEYQKLDHFRHSLLANLMRRAEQDGCKSAVAQDREARASREYTEFLEGLAVAHERSIRLKWDLEIAKWQVELYRTQEATRRVELRALGG